MHGETLTLTCRELSGELNLDAGQMVDHKDTHVQERHDRLELLAVRVGDRDER